MIKYYVKSSIKQYFKGVNLKLGFINIGEGFDIEKKRNELIVTLYENILKSLGYDVEIVDASKEPCDIMIESVGGDKIPVNNPKVCIEYSGESGTRKRH